MNCSFHFNWSISGEYSKSSTRLVSNEFKSSLLWVYDIHKSVAMSFYPLANEI